MPMLSRRRLLQSACGFAAAAAVQPAWAEPAPTALAATTRILDIRGRPATVLGLEAGGRFDGLRLAVGDRFRVRLDNRLPDEDTLIHWHGLAPPWRQDGVPWVSADPLVPGAGADYDFVLAAGGTHWMHSHHALQEQRLLAAPLIVRTPDEAAEDRQEVVVMLHDFSFAPPEELLAALGGGHGHGGMNHGGMDHAGHGGHGGMDVGHGGMAAMDLNDIEHDAWLANDRTLDDPEVVTVESGGRVRLRIINGAASTNFTIDLGALTGRLAAVDGRAVEPVEGSRFPLAMAQRVDLLLDLPSGTGVWPVLALREGGRQRTGLLLATPGAAIAHVDPEGTAPGPVVGLELEHRLRAVAPLAERPADRRLDIVLTGSMDGYRWGMDGLDPDLRLVAGERVEIAMRNDSPMSHPMPLHGHAFQVVAIDGHRFAGAVRDTVQVPVGTTVTIAFDADNPGHWAFHCHHLYHMAAGMMAVLHYADV